MKEMIKKIFKYPHLWAGLIPVQVFGLWALYNLFTGTAPEWWWIGTIIGYVCMKTIGISAGYHRYLSHKGYEMHPWIERLVIYFGILAVQGSPITWVAIHRGYHHRFSDKDGDPHSPKHGFWHSYILWMFQTEPISIRSCVDLLRDKFIVFVHEHYKKILWISHGLVAIISVDLWLYTMALPAWITSQSYSIQTSCNHIRWMGYRNYNTDDDSVNSPLLFPLILGECWHNNHHGEPKNPNYGGRHWWEVDFTFWIIKLIRQ
jgi:stearoyl-CoA desaturase (delta-9 desaturase)